MDEKEKKQDGVNAESVDVSAESTSAQQPSPSRTSGNQPQSSGTLPWLIGAVVVAIILIIVAIYLTGGGLPGTDEPRDPNGVVAVVDGVEISSEELDAQVARSRDFLLQQSGGELSDEDIEAQVMDGIINQTLLLSAAENAGINITEEEVDAFIESTIIPQFGSDEDLDQLLRENNATMEELRDSIKQQLTIEQYLLSVTGDIEVDPTEAEVQAQYEQFAELSGPDAQIPALETVYDQIAEEIRFQRLQELQAGILEGLRAEADIEINL